MAMAPEVQGRRRTSLAGALVTGVVVALVMAMLPFGSAPRDRPGDGRPPPVASASADPLPRPTAPLGVFVGTDARAAAGFAGWLGSPVDYVVDFSARDTWDQLARPDYLLQEWQGSGRRLVLAVPMLPSSGSASLDAGAGGAYDGYFRQLGQDLVAHGEQDAVLRVGWEFNLDGWPWSTPDPAVFAAYFRRIVAALRSAPGADFTIDWTVNNGPNRYDAIRYWPGDDVVDEVGVDAYDVAGGAYPYPPVCDAGCRSARQRQAWSGRVYGGSRGLAFWSAFAAGHGKPLALPEWGLWSRPDGTGGGDDPYYLRQMAGFIAAPGNHVAWTAYFAFDSSDGRHSLASFPSSAPLFRTLFERPQRR